MSRLRPSELFVALLVTTLLAGCSFQKHKRPSITARPANPTHCDAPGIPFYLPKPLLVISKNFHHIDEARVGLTEPVPIPEGFDDQDKYATAQLDSTVSLPPPTNPNSPPGGGEAKGGAANAMHSAGGAPVSPAGKIPSDGLAPHTFFTYELVFVPDLTQKYVMQIEGGAGEFRAAMNLVNGWQFTGLGPYYMKDSSTAQNVFSRGVAIQLGLGGAADVVNSAANLAQAAGAAGGQVSAADIAALGSAIDAASKVPTVNWDFAEASAWEDEMVPIQSAARFDNGEPILDAAGNPQWITTYVKTGRKTRHRMERYAEIYVYEASLQGGQMVWQPIAEHVFDREYLGLVNQQASAEGTTSSFDEASDLLSNAPAPSAAGPLAINRSASPAADRKFAEGSQSGARAVVRSDQEYSEPLAFQGWVSRGAHNPIALDATRRPTERSPF